MHYNMHAKRREDILIKNIETYEDKNVDAHQSHTSTLIYNKIYTHHFAGVSSSILFICK